MIKNPENTKKVKEIFRQLYESLRIHQHQEEILYSNYKHRTGEILPVLQTIRKEHEIILRKLDNINKAVNEEKTGLFPHFSSLLLRTRNLVAETRLPIHAARIPQESELQGG